MYRFVFPGLVIMTEIAPIAPPTRWQQFQSWFKTNAWPVIGLSLLVIIVYAPVVTYDFVNWDDTWYIVRNDLIKSWHPSNLYKVMTEPVARNFAPLTVTTFLVEHTLWELWPGGYHATNLVLHLINAVLVYALVRQLSENIWIAWLTAALFALHPVQVETVAWVSSRKTLLSATFMLASCICWLRPNRTGKDEGWGILWLVLGLLSKAATVVVPPIVVAYDVIIRKRQLRESIIPQIVPMLFSVMLIFITMSAQVTIVGGTRGHIGMNKLEILLIDSTLLWRYVAMLFAPHGLSVMYDTPYQNIGGWITLSCVAWAAVTWVFWKSHKQYPWLAFSAACWILLLVPVLNLFPITTLMNDRYLYLPCVPFFAGFLAGVAWLSKRLAASMPKLSTMQPRLAILGSVLWIGIMAWSTLHTVPYWKSPISLWGNAREHAPNLAIVQIQWALSLHDDGRTSEAIESLEYTLEHCSPDDADQERIERMLTEWSDMNVSLNQ